MTYYSDLLIVLRELEELEHGKQPSRSAPELRALCRKMLAIDPDEFLADQLLSALDTVPDGVRREGLKAFVFARLRTLFRR